MSKPTLTYFKARGRAELIRLVCAEAGIDYRDHIVGQGTPPSDGRPTDFAALKATGTLAFEAVPVWEEPGLCLAQSVAIASHLARTHGLRGKSAVDEAKIDEVLGGVEDVRAELRKLALATPEQRPAIRAQLADTTLPRWLGFFDRLLGKNRDGAAFVVGDGLTVADLALWYLLEATHDNGFTAAFAGKPLLVSFLERIAARPNVAAYLKSSRRPAFTPLPT